MSIGQILTGNFIFAFPGVQDFHPKPESWFQDGGGPVIDMGPYFFTTLVNLLGPAKNVRGRGAKFFDKREYKVGPKKVKHLMLKFQLLICLIWNFKMDQLFKVLFLLMFKII